DDLPTHCTWGRQYINPVCWFRAGTTWIAAIIISLAALFLELTGWLFNTVVDLTIVQFGTLMSSSVMDTVRNGWGIFRDISNIAIIGMFVFIAFCMILGIESYGSKKLVARVLVVAVLINFSFLFGEIVTNFSNIMARQLAAPLVTAGRANRSTLANIGA